MHNKLQNLSITQKHKYLGHLHFQSILVKVKVVRFQAIKTGMQNNIVALHTKNAKKPCFAVLEYLNNFRIYINDLVMVRNGNF